MKKVMILVIDGCNPAYLTEETAPDIFKIAGEKGFAKTVQCAMPSVTNVNHACILSGKWPEETKIIGNYFYNPKTEEEGFIEERGYMKAETILQRYKTLGGSTALFTVKGKVLGVYGDGADIGLSTQTPDESILDRYGLDAPPKINSVDASGWIVKAALECIKKDNPDMVYCTTNDYVFHHYAPGEKEAIQQIKDINKYIKEIHEADPKRQIYITADHGMNQKKTIVNFTTVCKNSGYDVFCLPPLKDKYIENHIYQEGGMIYAFLRDKSQADAFYEFAKDYPAVEKVLTKDEAAKEYNLPLEMIGDFVLLSAEHAAFGEVPYEMIHTDESRTHGSLYEREIPLIGINPEKNDDYYNYHKDITVALF